MADTYMEFPGMVVRIKRPELTESERAKRLAAIHKAAEQLLISERRKLWKEASI
jgi:ribosome recycling factor